MLKTVIIGEDIYDPSTWETFETEDICSLLVDRWEQFPSSGRIYLNEISNVTDVTPATEQDIENLQSLEGKIYVLIHPEDPVTLIVAVIGVAVAAAAAVFLAPPVPSLQRSDATSPGSPNNELSNRENRPRVNGRIPDIYGTVRSTPCLLYTSPSPRDQRGSRMPSSA